MGGIYAALSLILRDMEFAKMGLAHSKSSFRGGRLLSLIAS